MLFKPYYPLTLLILAVLASSLPAMAQLQASFTVDKPGGCSPLSVKFTNTSTGGSASTTYSWDFGNGNSSALANPGATYYDEKTYTITLTARDGAASAAKTIQVTVYKKPVVDFTVSPARGCVPMTANFAASATPGDGTVATYYWDFGDGATQQGTSPAISHNYTFSQKPPISLTVTNSFGCYTTALKNNVVEVAGAVSVVIKPSLTSVCNAGDEISFAATVTGSGTLAYAWDFGDGSTSTLAAPKHAFATAGAFTVKLKVTSPEGCSADAVPVPVNVANFNADFDIPALICQNQLVTFQSKSTAGYDRLEWWLDNTFTNNNGNTFNHYFPAAKEYNVKLQATYGTCVATVTKKVTVNRIPQSPGFVIDLLGACGAPVTVNFKDTTSIARKWEWSIGYGAGTPFASTQNASYTYTSGVSSIVSVKLTTAEGCSAVSSKYFDYGKPSVNISTVYLGNYSNCTGATYQFVAKPDTLIKTFSWDFGDGSTSTDASPKHVFATPGNFTVRLHYTTKAGCQGTELYGPLTIYNKPVFDFAVDGSTTVCGNSFVTFRATPAAGNWFYSWDFGGQLYSPNPYGSTVTGQYYDGDGVYTIKLVVRNGNCYDTVIKKNYITHLPPIPRIKDVLYSCEGSRGMVRFTENSYKAQQWHWDFGDGNTDSYSSRRDTTRHTYSSTGHYKLVLSTTNGPCTTRDSTTVYVLMKQNPVLASAQADVCGSGIVPFTITGLEKDPRNNNGSVYTSWPSGIQYGDQGVEDEIYYHMNAPSWLQNTSGTLYDLKTGQTSLRLIIYSYFHGCYDTSNFIPLKIHGPIAGFTALPHSGCFKDPLQFKDTSNAYPGAPITSWTWTFGDGKMLTNAWGDTVAHLYNNPGYYYPTLTVIDADGCKNATGQTAHYLYVGGPKADFYFSTASTIPPNTQVNFYNNSLYYYNGSTRLQWIMPDGTRPTTNNPYYLFKDAGVFPVTLITTNLQSGCTDTITKTITVKKVNSAFTYTLSYINSNSCPPVIARFTSNSTNAVRLGWSFGDGGVAGDQKIVAHTYNTAGIYRVVHYSYDANNAVDSTEDYIEVKGPYALLSADTLYGCNSLAVQLNAVVKYAKDYTWDFGDGTLLAGTDTFAAHQYLTPGIYTPALILTDAGGCTATSTLPGKIIVDSLSASFSYSPVTVCNAGTVAFLPQASSLSQSRLQAGIQYRWIVTEAAQSDTLYSAHAAYYFSQLGDHPVQMQASSAFGCSVTVENTIKVKPGVSAGISGPAQVCRNDTARFSGTAQSILSPLQWLWNFGTGTSTLQHPPAQVFATAGQQMISLVVSNGDCADTARFRLDVMDAPHVAITPVQPVLCLGDSMALAASGGDDYHWSPGPHLLNAGSSTAVVWPAGTQYFFVKASNQLGCASYDSVLVQVVKPFQLTATSPVTACQGSTAQLAVSGAATYHWQQPAGLNNSAIANPVASTDTSRTYTVVGYDAYGCFTDTASVLVKIAKLPAVSAGPDYQILAGTATPIPTTYSHNVVKWEWLPADYLSCTNCSAPVSTPRTHMQYVVQVTSVEGCMARDTVRVELICKSELLYIPTGFTPNGDNLNDRFAIHGRGIKEIRRVMVVDRWGKPVFERAHVQMGDRNSSWDGNIAGQPAPSAAYVYMIEVECDGGAFFTYQGTVTLIR